MYLADAITKDENPPKKPNIRGKSFETAIEIVKKGKAFCASIS
jgi:hypothetical protein